MSVTFHLYKPIKTKVKWGKYYYASKSERKEIEAMLRNYEDTSEYDSKLDEYLGVSFEQEKDLSEIILINNPYSESKKRKRQIMKAINYMKSYYKNYLNYTPQAEGGYPVLFVKELCYRQGWYLNKRFFNHENTIFYAFDKKHMKSLIRYYVESSHWHDFDEFFEKFEDEMIFEIAF